MKYCLENQLNMLEFHDSEWSLLSFEQDRLVVSAKHLNIHKEAKENPYDCDMEIDLAIVSFCGTDILSFEPMREYKLNDDGDWYTDEPQIIFKDEDAKTHFIEGLKTGITINCTDVCKENDKTVIEISTTGDQNHFFATFAFDSVLVEWDEYRKKAWYELHKQYEYEIALNTPKGELKTEAHIVCHEEDMYYQGKLEKAPIVNFGIKYDGQSIWGQGKDYLWVDAFADLQNRLPEGVVLKCCMTCRHGNMCPYGNTTGEIFCTKDLTITSKDDMCDLFADPRNREMAKRLKHCTDNCNDYQPQSQDHYTYNDYLYHLLKYKTKTEEEK